MQGGHVEDVQQAQQETDRAFGALVEVGAVGGQAVVTSGRTEIVERGVQIVDAQEPVEGLSLQGEVATVLGAFVGGLEHEHQAGGINGLLVKGSGLSSTFVPTLATDQAWDGVTEAGPQSGIDC